MEESQNKQLNVTYIIIALIIGGAIIGFGYLNYMTGEKNREMEQLKLDHAQQAQQQAKDQEQSKTLSNQKSLRTCLQNAQSEFDRLLQLNSYSNPQLNYPDARTWNSTEIKDSTQKKLQDDKVLCAKFYRGQ